MNLVDLANQVGINPKWKASTNGGEYHSSCPTCGGKDRFVIQPYKQQSKCIGSYFCRQCGSRGDLIQFYIDYLGYTYQDVKEEMGINDAPNITSLLSSYKKPNKLSCPKIIKPSDLWKQKALAYVNWASRQIAKQSEILKYLNRRGLPDEAINLYKIGWCSKEIFRNKKDWGIESINESRSNNVWLPQGIVIPTLESNGDVARIKIRRENYSLNDALPKYIGVTGGLSGLNIIGDTKKEIMIVVESELDGFALHYALRDIAFVIAVGSNLKNPDYATDHLAKQKIKLLILPDNDEGGINMANKWQELYPHAQICFPLFGKDIGEAIEQGLDIKEWIYKFKT